MQGLRHLRDLKDAVVEAVVGGPRPLVVAGIEGLGELFGHLLRRLPRWTRPQVPDIFMNTMITLTAGDGFQLQAFEALPEGVEAALWKTLDIRIEQGDPGAELFDGRRHLVADAHHVADLQARRHAHVDDLEGGLGGGGRVG